MQAQLHTSTAMASQQQEHRKSMSMAMVVPQLLTPDQPLADSFTVSVPGPPRMPSPPASPEFDQLTTQAAFQHKDDVLYPDHTRVDSIDEEKPLFENSGSWASPEREQRSPTASSLSVSTPRSSISNTDEANDDQLRKASAPKSPVGPIELFNTYGLEYWRYVMTQNEEFRARQRALRELPPPTRQVRRDRYTDSIVSSLGRARITKPGKTSPTLTRTKTPKPVPAKPSPRTQAAVTTPKVESQPKRSRRKTATPDPTQGGLSYATPPKARTRAAPTKKIDPIANTEWFKLPDYCPPTNSLDNMSKKMHAVWNNSNPLNLDNDPEREHLHPQELVVASTLRLHCNSYLANKRRIFAARFTALQDGKEFNKTSAQTSAKIDVNKASKLWEAFDSVGWFDRQWFEQYL